MLKAMGVRDGRKTLMIGLSFGNLDKFRAEPLDTFILIKAEDVDDLYHDVMIFSGRTEEDMAQLIMPNLTPDAKVRLQAATVEEIAGIISRHVASREMPHQEWHYRAAREIVRAFRERMGLPLIEVPP